MSVSGYWELWPDIDELTRFEVVDSSERRRILAQEEARLVEEAASISRRLHRIRSQQNDCILVCTLPAEILCLIFLSVRQADGSVWDIIAISQVCQRWREIALGNSELWTHLTIRHGPFSLTLVERAAGRPLHLQEWHTSEQPPDWLTGWMKRVQTVDLELSHQRMQKFSEYLALDAWDSLESLSLAVEYDDLAVFTANFGFGGQVPPMLQHLQLRHVGPSFWNGLMFGRNLRTLDLELDKQLMPNFAVFMRLLNNHPTLEILKLTVFGRWPYPAITPAIPPSAATVTLETIRHIELQVERDMDSAALFRHLNIPLPSGKRFGFSLQVHTQDYRSSESAGPLFSLPADSSNLAILETMTHASLTQGCTVGTSWLIQLSAYDVDSESYVDISGWLCNASQSARAHSFRLNLIRFGTLFDRNHLTSLEIFVSPQLLLGITIDDWRGLFHSLRFLCTFKYKPFKYKPPLSIPPEDENQESNLQLQDHADPPAAALSQCLSNLLTALEVSGPDSLVAPSLTDLHLDQIPLPILAIVEDDIARCVQNRREHGIYSFQLTVNGTVRPLDNPTAAL
ncbi:hypothetical protein BXZ70DRAFT_931247 [Cristinia sonorae]|uniref:F-box domain-containing protein n=1 Tax=Cristinia sonorae TaxID=1940300 RepID=A0A8K0XRI9_9AGAR|nr:hypothetical protein BXZ70DRAFT_931247 [Cristinia sonorae]